MFLLNDFSDGIPLSGNKRKLLLPEHSFQQTEGVAFDDSLSLFFTREYNFTGPGLYHTDVTTVIYPNGINELEDAGFSVLRFNGSIKLTFDFAMDAECRVEVYNLEGRILAGKSIPKGAEYIEFSDPAKD